jgi:3-deoxy-D-manno-octulosonic-acid transferase
MPLMVDLVYVLAILAASPWLIYSAWRHGKYREGLAAKFLGRVPPRDSDRPCIWFHAVSVGEVNLLKTLIDRMTDEFPGWDFVISTTTKTGYELARKKYAAYSVFYAPLDFSWAVREAMRRLRPELLVLAELELWPNWIAAANRQGCRIAIANARLSAKSFRGYRWLRPLLSRVLRHVDLIAAQNEEYADRFRQLGARPERIHVTGSVKFDGVQTDRANEHTSRLRKLTGMRPSDMVFLAGSTQDPEESLALDTYNKLCQQFPQLRLIVVPRHATRWNDVAELLDRSNIAWQRRTEMIEGHSNDVARVLLVDTIGELGAWWGTADIAFVGGSLGSRGGQNMIEPAAYGAAVAFGPSTRNFRDVVQLLTDHDAAVVVHDGEELTEFVRRCLEQRAWATAIGERARQAVLSQKGAAGKTVTLLVALSRQHGSAIRQKAA